MTTNIDKRTGRLTLNRILVNCGTLVGSGKSSAEILEKADEEGVFHLDDSRERFHTPSRGQVDMVVYSGYINGIHDEGEDDGNYTEYPLSFKRFDELGRPSEIKVVTEYSVEQPEQARAFPRPSNLEI